MKVRGSYWAELSPSDGTLVPAGVLVASKTKLVFRAYPEFGALQQEVAGRIASALGRGLSPDEVLDYHVERSNGMTVSVSRPRRMDVRSIEDAAERLLAESKHHV